MATKKTKTKTVVKAAKKVAKKETKEVAKVEVPVVVAGAYASVLSRPRITEKASYLAQTNNVYTFNVSDNTNKKEIEKAVFSLYKVQPVRVSVVNTPAKKKRNMRTGKYGTKGGSRKAYVYLKKGDSINLF